NGWLISRKVLYDFIITGLGQTVLWIVPSTSLICYDCWCLPSDISTCNCPSTTDVGEGSFCTIVENFHSSEPYVELAHNSESFLYTGIKDPYYIQVDEAIFYNETTNKWEIKIIEMTYGCDWDYCNEYSLISILPNSLKLDIDEEWLTTNIFGTGVATSCHTCTNETCGNQTQSIDYDQCTFTSCDNSTTCLVYSLWHNIETDESCYYSECTQSSLVDEFDDDSEKYQVLIQAVVYLSLDRSDLEIWQLSINCGVDNCSRSSIFQEIKAQIKDDMSNLTYFPIARPTTTPRPLTTTSTLPIRSLSCYNCSCTGTTCPCTTFEISSADNTYCYLERKFKAQDVHINFGHININSTYVYIRDYPFVLIEESIIYQETTGRWDTRIESVMYGCDWNLCNKPELIPYLPSTFLMRLPELWLNSSILGTGQPTRNCHICPSGPVCSNIGFINGSQCPILPCNTTCLVSSKYTDPASIDQCYDSYCAAPDQPDFEIDKHRIQLKGILYSSRPTNVELWETDLYCRADDCSNPETFKELRENLIVQPGDITAIFNQTAEPPTFRCFDCFCEGEVNCECNTVSSVMDDPTYCTITRTYDGENVYIYFSHLETDSSYLNIRDFPYILVSESIIYNNETGKWLTRTNEVVYGCDWDYCNRPALLPLLPFSLQMTLPESWLNSSILGTGESTFSCHECANASICSLNQTIDGDSCPVQPCTTTCRVSNTYNNLIDNQQCYQSYCVSENSEKLTYDSNLVKIEGILYANQPTHAELWEVNIYCQVDNCSRPDIFQEIKQDLIVNLGNITEIFNQANIGEPGQLHCYECYCVNDPICDCNKTVPLRDNLTFCTIIRLYDGQDFYTFLEHIDRNSTHIYIREFPFLLVDESILYNEANGRWNTKSDAIIYGCNTDFCNDPRLVPKLPVSFQMRLSESWLNDSVLGTGQPVRDCHECPEAPQCGTGEFLDSSRCPIKSCNTTCRVSDTYDDPEKDELCYQSFCVSPDSEFFEMGPHRVEIEGILYGNRPNAQVELWEVDIFCRADDCSRPEIFKELQAGLVLNTGDLSAFFNITTLPTITTTLAPPTQTATVPPTQPRITCYDCACYDNPDCSCNTVKPADAMTSYCTIIRVNYENGHFTTDLEHIDRNSTRVYIRKFPYVLAEESILYNETTKSWSTRANILVYGCNWNLCNHPSLVKLLPDSFKMTLNDEWLNTNILYNGSSSRDCHQCPEAPQCGTTEFLDSSRCPVKPCNTTCIVSDTFDDPEQDELCYQSYCASADSDPEENQHRVELEGIIYGDQPTVVELWEIDLYCRADDCSRPEIFNEIRQNLTIDATNITLLFDNSSRPIIEPELICYDCFCYDDPVCECETFTVYSAKSTYCTIIRDSFGEDYAVVLEHINRNSTRVYISEFPYLLVEESIIYNETTKIWSTINNVAVFGCNWDYCNNPSLISHLPDSFQMRLPDAWLNTNVLGTGQPVRDCHECPEAPQCGTSEFIDAGRCPVKACNTTCVVSDTYDDPEKDELCYQSFCAPPDSEFFEIDPHRVEMEGVIYGSRPRNVELWEVDIFCRGDDCSRPELFKEIREQFCVKLGDYTAFFGNASTGESSNGTNICSTITTSTVTTTPSRTVTSTTTTSRPATSITTTSRITTPTAPVSTTSTNSSIITTKATTVSEQITTTSSASTSAQHTVVTLFFMFISLISFY
ncbi:unnamed protein product, partial [Rotaria socialis]